MKTVFVKKRMMAFVAMTALAAFSLTACKKDDSTGMIAVYMTSGDASGGQMKPIVSTSGSGTLSGSYNTTTKKWDYIINWSTLTDIATTVQFRGPAVAGEDGALISDLGVTTGGVTGSSSGVITLTDAQATALITGKVYYVIANPTFPAGEIRGQVVVVSR